MTPNPIKDADVRDGPTSLPLPVPKRLCTLRHARRSRDRGQRRPLSAAHRVALRRSQQLLEELVDDDDDDDEPDEDMADLSTHHHEDPTTMTTTTTNENTGRAARASTTSREAQR